MLSRDKKPSEKSLPKVRGDSLPFYHPSSHSLRGYVNLKSHSEGNETEIEDFPNTLLEIPLDIPENSNYVLVCCDKDDVNCKDAVQLINLAHASTSALTSQSFELRFPDSDSSSFVVWTASNATTLQWLSVFDHVITVANDRDWVLKNYRMRDYKVDEYIETQDL